MKEAARFRAYIDAYYGQYPELFPEGFAKGYRLHDRRKSKKMADLLIRRIKLTNGEVYSIVPCDVMPYLTGKTQQASKGLMLRKYGVPYEVIAQLLGRNAIYWQRLEPSLGRMSLATNKAWKALFENITIILCFLHGFLKIRDVAKHLKEDFTLLSTGLWQSYQKKTAPEFEQALAQMLSWAEQKLIKQQRVLHKLREVVGKATAYTSAACYPTSNQIDRPMNLLDPYLYQTRYFHGHVSSANLKIRAWAMLYNFSPFGHRTQKQNKKSRFEQLNGFVYHQDWLQNLLIAASLNGFAIHHKKR